MNIRKPVDYSSMFAALDALMAAGLPQMELYCEIGRLVSGRPEKGAAVAASEYLCSAYPDASGFSPRNLRRMREFYRTYEDAPEVLTKAMTIGWTQNAVILEAELILQDRAWYIRAVRQFGWSKLTLTEKIRSCAHNEASLDFQNEVCYTEKGSTEMRNKSDNKDNFLMLQQYLQEPDSRICDEGSGDENRIGEPIPHRVSRHQYRGDWKSDLSSGPTQAGRTWHRLRWQNASPIKEQRLQSVQPPDWDELGQSAEYAPDMWKNLRSVGSGDSYGTSNLMLWGTPTHTATIPDPTWADAMHRLLAGQLF